MAHVEWLTSLTAPNVFCEEGIVDKGIAIVLEIADSISTLNLLFRYGVLTMSLDEHGYLPRLELKIVLILHSELRAYILVV